MHSTVSQEDGPVFEPYLMTTTITS